MTWQTTKGTFSIAADTKFGRVAIATLDDELRALPVTVALDGVTKGSPTADSLVIDYRAEPSAAERLLVDQAVADHEGVPPARPEIAQNEKGEQIVVQDFAAFEGKSLWYGDIMTVPVGTSKKDDLLVEKSLHLYAGSFWVSPEAVLGDYIEFSVVDKDGVLPGNAPGDVQIAKYVKKLYVVPGERRTDLRSGKAAFVPAGLYLRAKYFSTGSSGNGDQDVVVMFDTLVFEVD